MRTNYAAEVAQGTVAGLDSVPQGSDAFTYWVEQRRQWAAGESSLYVDTSHARDAATLDNYGTWIYLDLNCMKSTEGIKRCKSQKADLIRKGFKAFITADG